MKKELYQKIKIPEGVNVSIEENTIIVKGKDSENKREFNLSGLELKQENGKIIIGSKQATKREKKKMNTIAAHIRNMIKGVQEKFEYTMKVCFSHFPITVEVKEKELIIKNFLGEKKERKARIPQGVDVDIKKDIITITSSDKELAGQAASRIEAATKIRNRDRRIFQDGIYLINKAGREI